ncbi:hypothetical protein TMEN_10047 [Trichophyton mentagrophytes]|uniref:Uncharacterized protein n=3 Tax=Trichophyton TaxID=5550 RepID=A0A059J1K6_TRIIM|nr:hypothetical protein TESG_08003 [Trichophyton tonsurans CBS 112818]EGE08335.1 hypothetical protein TEQG_07309 [Trichophyton equinum CBS 127.97]EZF29020.1 hypothetical protein H101_07291 [Trichophyton interdigitale H6]KAF3891948.1 hypothetical protein GY631_4497 [Trichophyton interdigitale]KDB21654.1 hypothetical protein H109_06417 [Trichophyton interdigitale MR816]GBF67321.1 hypothetical protein TMEN_10047 [Trichophyton mentagrophytes]
MKPTAIAYLLALGIFTGGVLAREGPTQEDKQKYDCSVYGAGSVRPSEEDTKSACQKAEGLFCHPEMEDDETFFCIIDASDSSKVTAFEEACKVDTQYLVSYLGSATTEELEKCSA